MTTSNILSQLGSAGVSTGFKNRIINGAMVIDQRNNGASVTPTAKTYIVDRFFLNPSQASKFSAQQNAGSVTPPVGYTNYLGATSLSAYSVLSTDYFIFEQIIEGFNSADLQWGTANAKTVTLSFWVRSSLTGTFGGALCNGAFDRSYPFSYTISSANTWTQISVTISGDTSGTWIGATNGIGIQVIWGLGVGSNYSGTAGSWQAAGLLSVTGATSVVGTNGATFYITGVQLEVGTTATNFDYRPYGTELALCQRYYQYAAGTQYSGYGATYNYVNWYFKVTMRAAPTLGGAIAGTVSNTGTDFTQSWSAGSSYASFSNATASAEL